MRELGLEQRWRQWRASPRGSEEFLAYLSRYLYSEPGLCGFDSPDAAAEALLAYRSRIASLLDRYRECGSSFDAYVVTSLRFLAKSQRRAEKRRRERECACERSALFLSREKDEWGSEDEAEDSPAFATGAASEGPRRCGRDTRRHRKARGTRVLYLFLKCAWNAGDRETKTVAEYTGLSEEWLTQALGHARRFLEAERSRFERITARRDRSWSAQRILESRLAEEYDELGREAIARAHERARREYEAALEELRRFRPLVPNSVVARILRVPKGSVDSGLHYLRHEFDPACPEESLEGRLRTWISSSPPATPTSSTNSQPSSPDTGSSAPPTSDSPTSTSTKTAGPTSKTRSKRLEPSMT
jgi:hypothetical protein